MILSFLDKARRPAKKDLGPNSLINFPDDIEIQEAQRIYHDGQPFDVVQNEYFLDTNDKVLAFTAICNGITHSLSS